MEGDYINGLLRNIGIDHLDIHQITQTLKAFYNPNTFGIGREISEDKNPPSLNIKAGTFREIPFPSGGRNIAQNHANSEKELDFERTLEFSEATIENNLFEVVQKMDLPADLLATAFGALSYDVDFERDVHEGNTFKIVYERFNYLNGEFSHYGKILFASLELDDLNLAVYRHSPSHGEADYFMSDGTSVKRALMKTPIPSSNVSSNFGMRRHPISTYTRLHKGVDFRAHRGAPVLAAGEGVIQFKRRKGGYGNYLIIKHNETYSTAYAHLSRFASGLQIDQKVKQGDVVAYVGSTGRATGPHLHFELLFNGKRVNPINYRPAPGSRLKGKELEKFVKAKTEIRHFLEEHQQTVADGSDIDGSADQIPKEGKMNGDEDRSGEDEV